MRWSDFSCDAYIIENLCTWYGSLHQHVHVFTNKFDENDGVCLALLGRLMTNIRYKFHAWYVNTRVCVCACVLNNLSDNLRIVVFY